MLRDTTSRGVFVRVRPPHTSERRGGGGCEWCLRTQVRLAYIALGPPLWNPSRTQNVRLGCARAVPLTWVPIPRSRTVNGPLAIAFSAERPQTAQIILNAFSERVQLFSNRVSYILWRTPLSRKPGFGFLIVIHDGIRL